MITFDFTDFRLRTLKQDLLHRDFTINTLALELEEAVNGQDFKGDLIDLYGGQEDIGKKIIRMTSQRVFDEDPLRILRAFSISCALGFSIEKKTLGLIKRKRKSLGKVTGERVRDELFKILHSGSAYEFLRELDRLRILEIVLPGLEGMRAVKQGAYHHLDVLRHSFETLKQLELLIKDTEKNDDIRNYLAENISSSRKRFALMKLAALLHDIGKPRARRKKAGKLKFYGHERIGSQITDEIAQRLKLSNDERDALRKLVFWHLRPGYLGDSPVVSPRAKFRYFRDTGKESVSTLLLSLADQRAPRGPLTTQEALKLHEKTGLGLIKEYFRKAKEKKITRLVNGDELMAKFNLTPSPIIGRILSELEELQAIGKIKTKKEALAVAKKLASRPAVQTRGAPRCTAGLQLHN